MDGVLGIPFADGFVVDMGEDIFAEGSVRCPLLREDQAVADHLCLID